MNDGAKQILKSMLRKNEDYRQYPYTDITGHLTVGIGRNLVDRGISLLEAFTLLENDIEYFDLKLASEFNWYQLMDDYRKIALVNMCFNLGFNKFLEFHKMIEYLKEKNYDLASQEMLNSLWLQQVGQRAIELAKIIKTGNIER